MHTTRFDRSRDRGVEVCPRRRQCWCCFAGVLANRVTELLLGFQIHRVQPRHTRCVFFLCLTRNEKCQRKDRARANELELSGEEKVPGTLPMRTGEQHAQNCEKMLSRALRKME